MATSTYDLMPSEGIAIGHFIVSADVARAADFYTRILGGTIVMQGEPTIVKLANTWVIINIGGEPTDDKPSVTLRTPSDVDTVSAFMNIRVADVRDCFQRWSELGAQFLTEPKDHEREFRCFMRDPDGHLIEVGQSKALATRSG